MAGRCKLKPVELRVEKNVCWDRLKLELMTLKDNPTFENVICGHFNSRRVHLTYVFERGLVFQCHNT
jgi:hypothetical protein